MKSRLGIGPWVAVAVAALGYFVDVFDIILFSIVRTKSLTELGLSGEALMDQGINLLNAQMVGMLVGGVLFGVWGDKRGRLSVLFGSILLYSVANILNAFVTNVPTYFVLRFLAGVGLAGELGAGVTLVVEILPKDRRGLGTMIIATIGVAGGLVASIVTRYMTWRTAYVVAGLMGLVLLLLRFSVAESGLFQRLAARQKTRRGDLLLLFSSWERIKRFVCCLMPGIPIYFALSILVTFAPELGQNLRLRQPLSAADAVFYSYIGFILGDFLSGVTSQVLRSRKQALFLYVVLTAMTSVLLLHATGKPMTHVYGLYLLVGLTAGYWAVFITTAAEQFGTNLRATVATTVPNFVRGMVVPMTFALKALKGDWGFIRASQIVLATTTILALICVAALKESFSTDLDFEET